MRTFTVRPLGPHNKPVYCANTQEVGISARTPPHVTGGRYVCSHLVLCPRVRHDERFRGIQAGKGIYRTFVKEVSHA